MSKVAPALATPSAFLEHVRFFVYGDDNWCTISEEAREYFTPEAFASVIKLHFGQTVTPASKEGEFKFQTIEEMEFLKRIFYFDGTYWTGPLLDESIEKMLSLVQFEVHWYDPEAICLDMLHLEPLIVAAMDDATLGPQPRFEKLKEHIRLALEKYGLHMAPIDPYLIKRRAILFS